MLFCKFQVCFYLCVFMEERFEFGQTAIKPRSVEWCSDVYPYRFLPSVCMYVCMYIIMKLN